MGEKILRRSGAARRPGCGGPQGGKSTNGRETKHGPGKAAFFGCSGEAGSGARDCGMEGACCRKVAVRDAKRLRSGLTEVVAFRHGTAVKIAISNSDNGSSVYSELPPTVFRIFVNLLLSYCTNSCQI